jgi:hypothetical protein
LSKAFTRIGFNRGSPSVDTEGPCLTIQAQPFYDLTPQPPDQVAAMRITIHYLTAVVILTIYGGQV